MLLLLLSLRHLIIRASAPAEALLPESPFIVLTVSHLIHLTGSTSSTESNDHPWAYRARFNRSLDIVPLCNEASASVLWGLPFAHSRC